MAKDTILGTGISPRDFPVQDADDFDAYYDDAAEIGKYVHWISEWSNNEDVGSISAALQTELGPRGLLLIACLAPTGVANPWGVKIPAGLTQSFTDSATRQAFKDAIMAIAANAPYAISLGTEVNSFNMFSGLPTEWSAYVTLCNETYTLVKGTYPSIVMMNSFQWDVMKIYQHFTAVDALLTQPSMDMIGITSYLNAQIGQGTLAWPEDYYQQMRTRHPSAQIGVLEFGITGREAESGKRLSTSMRNKFSARPEAPGEPFQFEQQAALLRKLPSRMRPLDPEFVIYMQIYEARGLWGGSDLDYIGLKLPAGGLKPAWTVAQGLVFS